MIRTTLLLFALLLPLSFTAHAQSVGSSGSNVHGVDNSGATITLTPATRTLYVNGVQSLTAQVANSNFHAVTWQIIGGSGTIMGTGNTVGVQASSPGAVTVEATAGANGSTATATLTFLPPPTPNLSHPRILLTAADIPRLRAIYNNQNPIYGNGFSVALSTSINTYLNPHWSWTYQQGTGQPDAFWLVQDPGGSEFQAAPQYATEEHMGVLAFASLIEPNPALRAQYASMARDMLMWLMNKENGPLLANTPFRSPAFPVSDRMRIHGWAYGATVDWIYPTLSAADKAIILSVFHTWATAQQTSGITSSQYPQPIGVTNSVSLLQSVNAPLRWALNNHSIGSAHALLFESLALDAADDPTLANCAGGRDTLCSDGTANSMHAYISAFAGAWLFRQWAEYEDKGIVSAAYSQSLHTQLPVQGLGEASGGISLEGTEYEASIGEVFEEVLALHTAGLDDPAIYGPQVSFRTSSYFDLFLQSTMAKISPTTLLTHTGYYGDLDLYQFMNYADDSFFYILPETHAILFNIIAAADNANPDPARSSAMQWFPQHAVCCGDNLTSLYRNAGGNTWANSDGLQSITYFTAMDPATPAADPRAGYPLDYAAPWGRFLGRTHWTDPSASWVGYKCSFITIDHQAGDCGLFEWNRNGEWLAKEQVAYDLVTYTGAEPDHHNVLGIQNTPTLNTGTSIIDVASQTGGQFWNTNAGDPVTLIGYGVGYMSAFSDSTRLYNHPNQWVPALNAVAVTHASRSLLWIKPDLLVIYDRAATNQAGLFKQFHLQASGTLANNGDLTTETMPSGQHLFVQTLLPASGLTYTIAPADPVGADGDPVKYQLTVDASAKPASIRYLNVLEGADPNGSLLPATALHSGGGTAFDGAVIANTAVMFINTPGAFSATNYRVPTSATQHYVAGAAPGAAYTVIAHTFGNQQSITVIANCRHTCIAADDSGTLAFTTH